jgi:hypothetical protein
MEEYGRIMDGGSSMERWVKDHEKGRTMQGW